MFFASSSDSARLIEMQSRHRQNIRDGRRRRTASHPRRGGVRAAVASNSRHWTPSAIVSPVPKRNMPTCASRIRPALSCECTLRPCDAQCASGSFGGGGSMH